MKKKTAILLAVLLLVQIFAGYAYAVEDDDPTIQPYYTGVLVCRAALTLMDEATGYVKCVGSVSLRDSYTADMTMRLVRVSSSGKEKEIASWSLQNSTMPAMQYYRYVADGYTYNLEVDADIYDADGNFVENVSALHSIEY